ncbi:helicase domain protein [Desulforamulus ruminis DSM 2154]|uniref:Helicase domain protein n=2 Tax=Desulforamulus ruminis TaxID=1564 RepID=F6DQU7_DESRL|nr:helicase domain protein [Desulforamulus ruminis DSM 2154]
MNIQLNYNQKKNEVILICDDPEDQYWRLLGRIVADNVGEFSTQSDSIIFAWRYFLAFKKELAIYAKSHNIGIRFSPDVKCLLESANTASYQYALKCKPLDEAILISKLREAGFKRTLTSNQLRNLSKLASLPSSATFSVPGAGKTTEALAFYFINRKKEDKLLVVAPKNAFGAWDEQLEICNPNGESSFVRLRGGENNIRELLKSNPQYIIITYQQFPRVRSLVSEFISRNSVFVFLDESHRIKSGKQGVSAEAILNISYLPVRKLIMSGTPMPQSVNDLIPQINFLYPDIRVKEEDVISIAQPLFVRTTKAQLGLPSIEHKLISIPMDPLQYNIYLLLKSEFKRQLNPYLNDDAKSALRKIGKCTIKLMQFVSNPALLSSDMDYVFNQKLGRLLLINNGPKIEYACNRARQLAKEGKKVIIWTSFVENVELIAERLRDLGADFIHGGVDAGDEDDNDSREGKIKRFHDDPNCMVLVANPAAASEGISLHKVCQYAIYVDRSFNAAQYLQSEDRIHRLGLSDDLKPTVEIIECKDSIDEVIRKRLSIKVQRMAKALNDPSLNIDPIPYDFKMFDEQVGGMQLDDLDDIINYFFGGIQND